MKRPSKYNSDFKAKLALEELVEISPFKTYIPVGVGFIYLYSVMNVYGPHVL